jgi:thiamine-phosphate pyrophosphorylase
MAVARTKKRPVDLSTARLLDANLNRAREGLRVLEDTARFLWNDKPMVVRLRAIRHGLHRITAARYSELIQARDSRADVGRTVVETGRTRLSDVAAANMRRAQEAVRVLEEFSKVFSPAAAPEFKKIRYQLYTEEKRLLKRL